MHPFKIHVDDKENDHLPGNSKSRQDDRTRNTKSQGSALRDKNINAQQNDRAGCTCSSRSAKGLNEKNYNALLKHEIKNLLEEEKRDTRSHHEEKSRKGSIVQPQRTRRPSSSAAYPKESRKSYPDSRNIQYQRGDGQVKNSRSTLQQELKKVEGKRKNFDQQASRATVSSSSSANYPAKLVNSPNPLKNSTEAILSTASLPTTTFEQKKSQKADHRTSLNLPRIPAKTTIKNSTESISKTASPKKSPSRSKLPSSKSLMSLMNRASGSFANLKSDDSKGNQEKLPTSVDFPKIPSNNSKQPMLESTSKIGKLHENQRNSLYSPNPPKIPSKSPTGFFSKKASFPMATSEVKLREDQQKLLSSSYPLEGPMKSSTRSMINEPNVSISNSKVEKSQIPQRIFSPIPPNPFTSSNTLITRKAKSQRNAKLVSRAMKRSSACRSYVGDIYNEEYLKVIMENIVADEIKIVLPKNVLKELNPDREVRASIVNWMLEMQVQLSFTEEEFYLSVNLLDQVLARIHVPTNMFQLVALSSMWIANKLIGSDTLRASSLTDLCGKAYLSSQLLKMEQKILKLLNFEIHSIEPSLFVNYYLRLLEIDQLQIVRLAVYYILDCVTLLPDFSSERLSILAAAAVNVAIKIYCRGLREEASDFFSRNCSIDDIEKRKSLESIMYSQILNMNDENYLFRQAHSKYTSVLNFKPFSSIK